MSPTPPSLDDQGPGHAPPNEGGGGGVGAVQFEFDPPPLPLQLHAHGPVPVTALAVPLEQRPETGADAVGVLLDGPHAPFTIACDAHEDAVPPLTPLQLHVNGPEPDTTLAEPAEHKPLVGADPENCPFAGPHAPLTMRRAWQLTLFPPLMPLQFQSNGPAPITDVEFPVAHKPDVGFA